MQELIKEFMSKKRFAVVGASDNPEKYGNRIVKNLKARGYEVFPVNPRLKEVEGLVCYSSLVDIPVSVDVADFVVPPVVTEDVLKQCAALGIKVSGCSLARKARLPSITAVRIICMSCKMYVS
jgi:predicted CoA-binding protein